MAGMTPGAPAQALPVTIWVRCLPDPTTHPSPQRHGNDDIPFKNLTSRMGLSRFLIERERDGLDCLRLGAHTRTGHEK